MNRKPRVLYCTYSALFINIQDMSPTCPDKYDLNSISFPDPEA